MQNAERIGEQQHRTSNTRAGELWVKKKKAENEADGTAIKAVEKVAAVPGRGCGALWVTG